MRTSAEVIIRWLAIALAVLAFLVPSVLTQQPGGAFTLNPSVIWGPVQFSRVTSHRINPFNLRSYRYIFHVPIRE